MTPAEQVGTLYLFKLVSWGFPWPSLYNILLRVSVHIVSVFEMLLQGSDLHPEDRERDKVFCAQSASGTPRIQIHFNRQFDRYIVPEDKAQG